MTKDEYLSILRKELQALPHEEQTEAMNYYRSYFEDAGDENTASVIEELGAPEKLGAYIRSNFACVPGKALMQEKKVKAPETAEKNALSRTRRTASIYCFLSCF